MTEEIIVDPQAIETRSFEIIDEEAGAHPFSELEWPVVRRIVHTTADFEFITNTAFAPGALDSALTAIRNGAQVLCDTNMVVSGVSKPRLNAFGGSVVCHVADADVATEAKAAGITRSIVAMRKGVAEGCTIFLIGNAPTALYELLALTKAGKVKPALVIGCPVGFVGAEESKEALFESDLPYIVCRGRKGGSAIAAAAFNALTILAQEESA